jgi:hypothetical protein
VCDALRGYRRTVSEPEPRSGDARPPSWAGAPGFSPSADDLPPHAPMPGAPPYPEPPDPGPPPVGRPPRRGRFRALAAVSAALLVVAVVLLTTGSGAARTAGGVVLAVAVVTVVVGLLGRWVAPRG